MTPAGLEIEVARQDCPALEVTVALGADGRSRVARRHASFPWSLGRGFPGKPGEPVLLIPQVAGAGLLAGDHVTQRFRIKDHAALHLSSAGAMLTYGSKQGASCVSEWSAELGPGARAFISSEPFVLLDDANLEARQTLSVAPDATFIGCEGIVRANAGNRSQWQTETIVQRPDGTVLFHDRQRASQAILALQAKFVGRWTAFGTVLILAPAYGRYLAAVAKHVQDSVEGLWVGASPTRINSGVCVRLAATDGQRLRSAMNAMMTTLTQSLRPTQETSQRLEQPVANTTDLTDRG